MRTYKTTSEIRVRTSDGQASFFLPTRNGLVELDNDALGGKWVKIAAGSHVTLVASYEKTDTYLAALTTIKDGAPHIQGVALRRMSWNNIVNGSEIVVAKPAVVVEEEEPESEPEVDSAPTDDEIAEAELKEMIGDTDEE